MKLKKNLAMLLSVAMIANTFCVPVYAQSMDAVEEITVETDEETSEEITVGSENETAEEAVVEESEANAYTGVSATDGTTYEFDLEDTYFEVYSYQQLKALIEQKIKNPAKVVLKNGYGMDMYQDPSYYSDESIEVAQGNDLVIDLNGVSLYSTTEEVRLFTIPQNTSVTFINNNGTKSVNEFSVVNDGSFKVEGRNRLGIEIAPKKGTAVSNNSTGVVELINGQYVSEAGRCTVNNAGELTFGKTEGVYPNVENATGVVAEYIQQEMSKEDGIFENMVIYNTGSIMIEGLNIDSNSVYDKDYNNLEIDGIYNSGSSAKLAIRGCAYLNGENPDGNDVALINDGGDVIIGEENDEAPEVYYDVRSFNDGRIQLKSGYVYGDIVTAAIAAVDTEKVSATDGSLIMLGGYVSGQIKYDEELPKLILGLVHDGEYYSIITDMSDISEAAVVHMVKTTDEEGNVYVEADEDPTTYQFLTVLEGTNQEITRPAYKEVSEDESDIYVSANSAADNKDHYYVISTGVYDGKAFDEDEIFEPYEPVLSVSINTLDEFKKAIKDGGNYYLAKDIYVSENCVVEGDFSLSKYYSYKDEDGEIQHDRAEGELYLNDEAFTKAGCLTIASGAEMYLHAYVYQGVSADEDIYSLEQKDMRMFQVEDGAVIVSTYGFYQAASMPGAKVIENSGEMHFTDVKIYQYTQDIMEENSVSTNSVVLENKESGKIVLEDDLELFVSAYKNAIGIKNDGSIISKYSNSALKVKSFNEYFNNYDSEYGDNFLEILNNGEALLVIKDASRITSDDALLVQNNGNMDITLVSNARTCTLANSSALPVIKNAEGASLSIDGDGFIYNNGKANVVENKGELFLSSSAKVYLPSGSAEGEVAAIENNGSLTVESGASVYTNASKSCAIRNNGKLQLSGGYVYVENGAKSSAAVENNGEMTVDDAIVKNMNYMDPYGYSIVYSESNIPEVNGGTIGGTRARSYSSTTDTFTSYVMGSISENAAGEAIATPGSAIAHKVSGNVSDNTIVVDEGSYNNSGKSIATNNAARISNALIPYDLYVNADEKYLLMEPEEYVQLTAHSKGTVYNNGMPMGKVFTVNLNNNCFGINPAEMFEFTSNHPEVAEVMINASAKDLGEENNEALTVASEAVSINAVAAKSEGMAIITAKNELSGATDYFTVEVTADREKVVNTSYTAAFENSKDTMSAFEKTKRVYLDWHLLSSGSTAMGAYNFDNNFLPKKVKITAANEEDQADFKKYFGTDTFDINFDNSRKSYYFTLSNRSVDAYNYGIDPNNHSVTTYIAQDGSKGLTGLSATLLVGNKALQKTVEVKSATDLELVFDHSEPKLSLNPITLNGAYTDAVSYGLYDSKYDSYDTIYPNRVSVEELMAALKPDKKNNYVIDEIIQAETSTKFAFKSTYDSDYLTYVGPAKKCSKKVNLQVTLDNYYGVYDVTAPITATVTKPAVSLVQNKVKYSDTASAQKNIEVYFTAKDAASAGTIQSIELVKGGEFYQLEQHVSDEVLIGAKKSYESNTYVELIPKKDIVGKVDVQLKVTYNGYKRNSGKKYTQTLKLPITVVTKSAYKLSLDKNSDKTIYVETYSNGDVADTSTPNGSFVVSSPAYVSFAHDPISYTEGYLEVSNITSTTDGQHLAIDIVNADGSRIDSLRGKDFDFLVSATKYAGGIKNAGFTVTWKDMNGKIIAKPVNVKLAISQDKGSVSDFKTLVMNIAKPYKEICLETGEIVDVTIEQMAVKAAYKISNGRLSYSHYNSDLFNVVDDGKNLVVYPEYTALRDCKLVPGRTYSVDLYFYDIVNGDMLHKVLPIKIADVKKVVAAAEKSSYTISGVNRYARVPVSIMTANPYYGLAVTDVALDAKSRSLGLELTKTNAESVTTVLESVNYANDPIVYLKWKDSKIPSSIKSGAKLAVTLEVTYSNGAKAAVKVPVTVGDTY